jgi:hypothetical protein
VLIEHKVAAVLKQQTPVSLASWVFNFEDPHRHFPRVALLSTATPSLDILIT